MSDHHGIGWAVKMMLDGEKVHRRGWNGRGMFIVLMPRLQLPPYSTQDTSRKVNDRTAKHIGEDTPLDCQPYVAMWTAAGQWQPGWLCSQADLLAMDWEIAIGEIAPALHAPGAAHISTKSTELDSH